MDPRGPHRSKNNATVSLRHAPHIPSTPPPSAPSHRRPSAPAAALSPECNNMFYQPEVNLASGSSVPLRGPIYSLQTNLTSHNGPERSPTLSLNEPLLPETVQISPSFIKKTIYAITKPKTKSIKERSQNEKLSKSSRKNGASKNCSPSVTVSSSTHTNGHIPSRDIADRPPLPLPDFAMAPRLPTHECSAYYTSPRDTSIDRAPNLIHCLQKNETEGYCVCGIRTIQSVLIQGWTVHRSSEPSSFGRLYYINERENAIGWELPPEIEEQLSHELRVMLEELKQHPPGK